MADDRAAASISSLEHESKAGQLALDSLAGGQPDAVFGEPVTVGDYTIIPAREYFSNRKKTYIRPAAVVIIGPDGVQVRTLENRTLLNFARAAIAFWAAWGVVFALHPAWRGDVGLVSELRQLVQAARSDKDRRGDKP